MDRKTIGYGSAASERRITRHDTATGCATIALPRDRETERQRDKGQRDRGTMDKGTEGQGTEGQRDKGHVLGILLGDLNVVASTWTTQMVDHKKYPVLTCSSEFTTSWPQHSPFVFRGFF